MQNLRPVIIAGPPQPKRERGRREPLPKHGKKPPRDPNAPLDQFEAHNAHQGGRLAGFAVAHVAELGGVVALTLGLGWFGIGVAAVLYAEAAHHNYMRKHKVIPGTPRTKEDIARYADLMRVYGSPLENAQTSDNFKPYNEKRGIWSYRLAGFWGGLTSRSVVPCLIRSVPRRLSHVGRRIEYHFTPNDPTYRGRKRTDVGMFGLPKKKGPR